MDHRLLLVGAGHAHLFVLEALAAGRFPGSVRASLVTPTRRHLYSGMLPGLVGGRYRPEEITLDLAGLARAAGTGLVEATVVGIDPGDRVVRLEDGSSLPYDLVSFAIGSGVAAAELPGVAEHALFLKPIDRALGLPAAIDRLAREAGSRESAIAVVGAGAAGVEIALNLRGRMRRLGRSARIVLLDGGTSLVPDRAPSTARAVAAALGRNGIEVRLGRPVAELGPDAVRLEGGTLIRADLAVWATGAGAPALFRAGGLATDAAGFLLVDETLRSVSHPAVFAAGDAVTLRHRPDTPRAGVYAVREGPILGRNLATSLRGASHALRRFRPRQRHLVLLNTGDGRAVLSYGPVALSGRWVMALKDRIDRRFIARFSPASSSPGTPG